VDDVRELSQELGEMFIAGLLSAGEHLQQLDDTTLYNLQRSFMREQIRTEALLRAIQNELVLRKHHPGHSTWKRDD